MIVLLYGQPVSGKTTLAKELYTRLNQSARLNREYFGDFKFVLVDEEDWCQTFGGASDMAIFLEKSGFLPILSFKAPIVKQREYLKNMANFCVSIYLDRGINEYFDPKFEEDGYDLKINTTYRTIDDCVDEIMLFCGKVYK